VTAEHLLIYQRNIVNSTSPARDSRRTSINANMMLLKQWHHISEKFSLLWNLCETLQLHKLMNVQYPYKVWGCSTVRMVTDFSREPYFKELHS